MTDIEKLEDILHRETIKELETDIDEIPNTTKDIEKELRDTLTELNSQDLFIRKTNFLYKLQNCKLEILIYSTIKLDSLM